MKRPKILISLSNISDQQLEDITGDTEIMYSDKATSLAVLKAGGIPYYLPTIKNTTTEVINEAVNSVEGLLLTGADTNVDPTFYGEILASRRRIDSNRDKTDIALVKIAYKRHIPILGICKGMQLINVAFGGTLYQDIQKQYNTSFNHDVRKKSRSTLTHTVLLEDKSLLKGIFKTEIMHSNGGHSQAVKDLAKALRPVAIAEDGLIEAYEGRGKDFLLGIQFHAELRLFDESFFNIFKTFIEYCNKV